MSISWRFYVLNGRFSNNILANICTSFVSNFSEKFSTVCSHISWPITMGEHWLRWERDREGEKVRTDCIEIE